ncbi:MAG: hypothetical protein JWQ16_989, partial [Novosphingobium sp.]|nr:hypothetical protein [Novosphingobium sp.]
MKKYIAIAAVLVTATLVPSTSALAQEEP